MFSDSSRASPLFFPTTVTGNQVQIVHMHPAGDNGKLVHDVEAVMDNASSTRDVDPANADRSSTPLSWYGTLVHGSSLLTSVRVFLRVVHLLFIFLFRNAVHC